MFFKEHRNIKFIKLDHIFKIKKIYIKTLTCYNKQQLTGSSKPVYSQSLNKK